MISNSAGDPGLGGKIAPISHRMGKKSSNILKNRKISTVNGLFNVSKMDTWMLMSGKINCYAAIAFSGSKESVGWLLKKPTL